MVNQPRRLNMPLVLLIAVLTMLSACGLLNDDGENEPLTVKPISAVEVALEVSGNPGDQIIISRGEQQHYSFRLSQPDTVIYEAGLQPATTYTWSLTNQQVIDSQVLTARRQATTLDTTSSNFTWQTFSFGEHSSSVLYGVSIIDENNIWAVGEIYMNDSTGQADSDAYNVAHWNGNEWDFKKLQFYTFCNQSNTGSYPATSIITFSKNDLWISSASQVTRYNGTDQLVTECISTSVNKLWGTDSSNVYAAGSNSVISHYNGQDWQKIETGTELDFYDIHGNGEQGVVAVAAKIFESLDKAIYSINPSGKVQSLAVEGIPYPISGIWFDESGVTYIVGSGMYRKVNQHTTLAWQSFHDGITNNYLQAIDGNGLNDIVVAGAFGELLHFNGMEWKSFYQGIDGNLYDINLKSDFVVAAGYEGRQAYITIGERE